VPARIVTGFGPGAEHFIGVQAVNADVFTDLPEGVPHETVKALYPTLVAAQPGALRVYRSNAEFLDVGTAADYLRTVDIIARREGREIDRGLGTTVSPSATVRHSVLWDRVAVGNDAHLEDCIVADDVVVAPGARYARCVLVHGADGLVVAPF